MFSVTVLSQCVVMTVCIACGQIRNCKFNDEEIMVSFDVASLFPSIPVDIALNKLEEHLNKCNIELEKNQCTWKKQRYV